MAKGKRAMVVISGMSAYTVVEWFLDPTTIVLDM